MSAASVWPASLFDHRSRPGRIDLVTAEGSRHQMDASGWHVVTGEDQSVLERAEGPVLDVGCGPGRHSAELVGRGLEVLGLDVSEAAVRAALRKGAPAMHGSVFGPVPRSGEWATILLLDGNVGIGGKPIGLLRRCADLLRPGGRLLIETERPGVEGRSEEMRVEMDDNGDAREQVRRHQGPWFAWAIVSASQIEGLAASAGFEVTEIWRAAGRWFAELRLASSDEDESRVSLA